MTQERIRNILEEQFLTPIFGEEGQFPPAPPEALAEYSRLKNEWLITFPETTGIEPKLSIYPVKRGGVTRYAVTQEIICIHTAP